ncbi:unnamed protein product [Fraxinus pennsylvanica]|uniref:Protein kinase domain-containing protein n=1 Tax=Fraxinus pennsylvanica TaxID=56036 RepID=A0AAD1ZKP3_9LAMI|nr:unnamed protein product [Fraxinus pennsylvanica]
MAKRTWHLPRKLALQASYKGKANFILNFSLSISLRFVRMETGTSTASASAPATENYTHKPDHLHHRDILPSSSILIIVVPIIITFLILAILLLIVMLRRLQSTKYNRNDESGKGVINDSNCMFLSHNTININSSPAEVMSGGCLYGTGSNRPQLPKLRDAQVFTFKDLEMATDKFSEAKLIGNGAYGVVYRGILSDGTVTAIKMLHREGRQGERAFRLFSEKLNKPIEKTYGILMLGRSTEPLALPIHSATSRLLCRSKPPTISFRVHAKWFSSEASPSWQESIQNETIELENSIENSPGLR